MAMNLMGGILDKTGLGGFRSGLSDFDQMLHSRQDLTDKETINKIREQAYREEELNSPVKAAKRAFELAKAESDTTDILSGGYDQQRKTERDMKQAELLAKMDENQRKKVEDVANASVRAASLFSPEDTDLVRQSKYASAVEMMHAAGATGMPKEYSYQNWQQLMARAQAAPNTLAHIQARGLNDQQSGLRRQEALEKYGYDVGIHAMDNVARASEGELNRRSQQSIAAGHDAASIKAAGIRASSDGPSFTTPSRVEGAAMQRVVDALRNGTPVEESDLTMFYNKELAPTVKRVEAAIREQRQMDLMRATLEKDPAKKAAKVSAIETEITKEAHEYVKKNVPGADKFYNLVEKNAEMKKAAPAAQSNAPTPEQKDKYIVGRTYTDKNGNKAVYAGQGKFNPVTQ